MLAGSAWLQDVVAGTVSDVEARSLSPEPGPSGCPPSSAKDPLPSESLKGGRREGGEEGDSWGWRQGVVRALLQKPFPHLDTGMLSFLANQSTTWRKSQCTHHGRGRASTQLAPGASPDRTTSWLCYLGHVTCPFRVLSLSRKYTL